MPTVTVVDLAGVVYSAGKVFNGLSTGRVDTENFLRSGDLTGVTSRSDLALLEDLRDATVLIIAHTNRRAGIDADFIRAVNAAMTRSGALHPGQLRTACQHIGVQTRYGRHTPDAVDAEGLQRIVDETLAGADPAGAPWNCSSPWPGRSLLRTGTSGRRYSPPTVCCSPPTPAGCSRLPSTTPILGWPTGSTTCWPRPMFMGNPMVSQRFCEVAGL